MPQPRRGSTGAGKPRDSSNPISKNWGRWTVFGVLCVFLSSAVWFAKKNSVPVDQQTMCRTDRPPTSVTVLLIDVSDPLGDNERVQVLSEIERIQDGVPRFGMMEVYELGAAAKERPIPIFSICNPGRGAEVSEIYQNPKLVEKRWRTDFAGRLNAALANVISAPNSQSSPIMETIKSLSVAPMGSPRYDDVPKMLFIFSDFLQNTPETYSQYRRPFGDYRAFGRSEFATRVRSNLTGVDVGLYYIDRPSTHALQDGNHQRFWVDYFQASGAEVQHMKRILGD